MRLHTYFLLMACGCLASTTYGQQSPRVGEVSAASPGVETVTTVPGIGWALWSETRELLWIFDAPGIPLFGAELVDLNGDGDAEIFGIVADQNEVRTMVAVDGDGTQMALPGPSSNDLAAAVGPVRCLDIDGDGQTEYAIATLNGIKIYRDFAWSSSFGSYSPSGTASIAVADVLLAAGEEVLISLVSGGNTTVEILQYDQGALSTVTLPQVQGSELGTTAWPAAVVPTSASSADVAQCDESGQLYLWTIDTDVVLIDPTFPLTAPRGGAVSISTVNGGARILVVPRRGELTLFDESGNGSSILSDHPATARGATSTHGSGHHLVSVSNTLVDVQEQGGVRTVQSVDCRPGAAPPAPLPSDVSQTRSAATVWINGSVVGEELLPGDFLPEQIRIVALVASPSAGDQKQPEITVTSGSAGSVNALSIVPTPNGSEYAFALTPGPVTVTIFEEHEAIFEESFRVESTLRLERLLAYPNPATDLVELTLESSMDCVGSLDIYTVAGRRIHRIPSVFLRTGYNGVAWDLRTQNGDRVANGTYLLVLTARWQGHNESAIARLSVAR